MNRRWLYGLGVLLAAALVVALVGWFNRVSTVTVAPGGDYALGVLQGPGQVPVELELGEVHTFHLRDDADAAGFRIEGLATSTEPGTGLVHGAVAGGSLTGTYPNPGLAEPVLFGDTDIGNQLIAAGRCIEINITIPGAAVGDAVAVSSRNIAFESGLVLSGRVAGTSLVAARLCALKTVSTSGRTVQAMVIP